MMQALRLADFYTTEHIERALEGFRTKAPWNLNDRLQLYVLGRRALESSGTDEERRVAYKEMYEKVLPWWVRPKSPEDCWKADEALDVLLAEFEPHYGRRSRITAMNPDLSDWREDICLHLQAMRSIKPNADYPWMPVSKVLHFFNPRLFPMYDRKYVWLKVAKKVFKRDYLDFCDTRFDPDEESELFNFQYTLWASEVMRKADKDCMPIFARWFAKQVRHSPESEDVLRDLDTYYAAAFEIIAIGAALLET